MVVPWTSAWLFCDCPEHVSDYDFEECQSKFIKYNYFLKNIHNKRFHHTYIRMYAVRLRYNYTIYSKFPDGKMSCGFVVIDACIHAIVFGYNSKLVIMVG